MTSQRKVVVSKLLLDVKGNRNFWFRQILNRRFWYKGQTSWNDLREKMEMAVIACFAQYTEGSMLPWVVAWWEGGEDPGTMRRKLSRKVWWGSGM